MQFELDDFLNLDIERMLNEDALILSGTLIDIGAAQNCGKATDHAYDLLISISKRSLSDAEVSTLHYFFANYWSNKSSEVGNSWEWGQFELQNQILELRKALNHKGFADIDKIRQCQILTNLANTLNTIGRFAEAMPLWKRALEIEPKFGMALSNLGCGFYYYAHSLYDPGHAVVLLSKAHDCLSASLLPEIYYDRDDVEDLKCQIEDLKRTIETEVTPQDLEVSLGGDVYGASEKEIEYRQWCLENCLFINPLNDVGAHSIATRDVLTLPDITLPEISSNVPQIIGYFNQIKQEYATARYLFYEGLNHDFQHFSDNSVLLYNTLDFTSYGLGVEKLKMAYRMAYSLLDKVGFFINDYFKVGLGLREVSFRNVWYQRGGNKDGAVISPLFSSRENWPLRGLFWLSKDIYDEDIRQTTEPDAQDLYNIRNHLEHKFLKIHDDMLDGISPNSFASASSYSITKGSFCRKTMRLFHLVRAAIIYLSLAVHVEERAKDREHDGGLIAPMPLFPLDDEWKT